MSAGTIAGRPSNLRLILAFTSMVTVWSLSFVVVKVVTQEVPPLFTALLRAIGTAIALVPLAIWEHRKAPARFAKADALRLVAVSLTGVTLNQICFIVGVSSTSVAHSSIVLSLAPMLVLLVAVTVGQEQARVRQFAGMAIAMVGVGWLQIGRGDGGVASPVGDLMAFLSAVSFSIYSVLNKSLSSRYGGAFVNATSFAIGAAGMLPFGLWAARGTDWTHFPARVWWGLAYMVLFQGVVGYSAFYYLLQYVPATRVSLYSYVQPVQATFFAWLLLSEPVTFGVVVAGAIVAAGVWLTMKSPGSARRSTVEAR